MADRIRIEHDFDCTEATFMKLFLDDGFNRALFRDYLKFPRWEVTHTDDQEKALQRTVEVEPYVADLPGPIKKVVGENIAYREVGKLDKSTQHYFVEVVPARLADKFHIRGEQFTEPLEGGKRCKRVFVATVEVKVFGVGGLIEKRILADLQKSYDLSAKFTRRYIEEHGLSS